MAMKSEEKRAKQEAAGIPDSRMFNDPETASLPNKMDGYHINGVLIGELGLRPEILAALDYYATDEGVAEKNARPMVREASGVELGQDPFHKALEQKRDDVLERDYESYAARDPLREVADEYAVPGMRSKFLNAKKTLNGGNRDYQVVRQANGDPVKVQGMLLGHIPEGLAASRNRHYQSMGGEKLKQIADKFKAEGGPTAVADQ